MPEVRGLINKCIDFENSYLEKEELRSIKLIGEIEELKDYEYELIYDSNNEVYSLFFEANNKFYCLDTDIFIDGETSKFRWGGPSLYKIVDSNFEVENKDLFGDKMRNLYLKYPDIIIKHSTERIKFLLGYK